MNFPLRKSTPPPNWPANRSQAGALIPVIAGHQPITTDTIDDIPCVACKTADKQVRRGLQFVGSEYLMLCLDAAACARRYRAGRTPMQYAREVLRAR